jgi:hypothetical protein
VPFEFYGLARPINLPLPPKGCEKRLGVTENLHMEFVRIEVLKQISDERVVLLLLEFGAAFYDIVILADSSWYYRQRKFALFWFCRHWFRRDGRPGRDR